MNLIDLIYQVQKVLPVRFGGTGNQSGWGRDAVISSYPNGSGGTLTRGTLVALTLDTTFGNLVNARTVGPTTSSGQQTVVGVVVGHFSWDTPYQQFVDEDVPSGESAAVCIFGRCLVSVESAVEVGQYAFAGTSDGEARGESVLAIGAMGQFESSGSGVQWVRLWGASATPGLYGAILVTFGDNTYPLQVGSLVDIPAPPFSLDIVHWTMTSTLTGSVQLDIRRDVIGSYPPTSGDSIVDSDPPFISTGLTNEDDVPHGTDPFGTPTGWDSEVNDGDVLRVVVASADGGVKQVSLLLDYVRI